MEDRAAAVAKTIAYGSSATAATVGWTVNDFVAVGGILLGIATFLLNWYYRHKHLELARLQIEQRDANSTT